MGDDILNEIVEYQLKIIKNECRIKHSTDKDRIIIYEEQNKLYEARIEELQIKLPPKLSQTIIERCLDYNDHYMIQKTSRNDRWSWIWIRKYRTEQWRVNKDELLDKLSPEEISKLIYETMKLQPSTPIILADGTKIKAWYNEWFRCPVCLQSKIEYYKTLPKCPICETIFFVHPYPKLLNFYGMNNSDVPTEAAIIHFLRTYKGGYLYEEFKEDKEKLFFELYKRDCTKIWLNELAEFNYKHETNRRMSLFSI